MLIFFFNDTATTEIYTLSLHDALPIYPEQREPRGDLDDVLLVVPAEVQPVVGRRRDEERRRARRGQQRHEDRKSTRLNSSHANISYAVFCLKKKRTHAHSGAGILKPRD